MSHRYNWIQQVRPYFSPTPLIFKKLWVRLSRDMWPPLHACRVFERPRNHCSLCPVNNEVPSLPQILDWSCPGPYITWIPPWIVHVSMQRLVFTVYVYAALWGWWHYIPPAVIQHCSKLLPLQRSINIHNANYFVCLWGRQNGRGWHFSMPGRMWGNHENSGQMPKLCVLVVQLLICL